MSKNNKRILGYVDGKKPLYYKEKNMTMDKFAPFFKYAFVAIVAFLFGYLVSCSTSKTVISTNNEQVEMQLQELKVAWIPETEQVAFINRKNNAVVLILSKEVTLAVFSLKASAMQQDVTSVTKGGVASRRVSPQTTTVQK